ncbi:MAG: hypothetical protein ACFFHD_16290 [Promethearchaeota archaeon]
MSKENASLIKYFLFLLISSIGSVIILTIFPFGGWIISDQWSSTNYRIYLFESLIIPLSIVLFIIIILFIFSTVLSLMSLNNLTYLNPLKHYKIGRLFTVISVISIVGLLIFLIVMGLGSNSWYIGVSFYEGLSSSVLNLVLYTIIIRKIKKK